MAVLNVLGSRRAVMCLAFSLFVLSSFALSTGCGKKRTEPRKLKVAYLGLTCEAPIFVAVRWRTRALMAGKSILMREIGSGWDGLSVAEGSKGGQGQQAGQAASNTRTV